MPFGDPNQQGAKYLVLATIGLFIAAFATSVGYFWWMGANTTPTPEGFTFASAILSTMGTSGSGKEGFQPRSNSSHRAIWRRNKSNSSGSGSGMAGLQPQVEGFYAGPAVGAGVPNCMQSSKDCAALYALLSRRLPATEEGPDDLRELQLILGKISCFKRDLTGVAGVVEATRYQPFSTAHDLEAVAETTARCFARTIPQRDLSLSLDKWGSRGTFLIKRLCTSEKMSEAEEMDALRLFGDAMADISEIALGRCCNTDVGVIAGQPQPRTVGGLEPPALVNVRKYDGYY
jgi:hypothetical protein